MGEAAEKEEEEARVDGILGSGQVKWLSTTGGPYQEEEESTESISVLLDPVGASAGLELEEVHFGTKLNYTITVGRSDKVDVILPIKAASKTHCQILLRQFKLDDSSKVHEAIFLRDLSKNGTMVNNQRANQPIQWLQDGDVIGIQADSVSNKPVLHTCWKVVYCKHHRFRLRETQSKPPNGDAEPEPTVKTGAEPKAKTAAKSSAAAKQQSAKAKAKGKAGKAAAPAPAPLPEALGEEVVGRVVEIAYIDPPETYRVKIMKYDAGSQFHTVDSTGYSMWDDESFQDTLDLNVFSQAGRLKFVEAEPCEVQPKKKAKTKC